MTAYVSLANYGYRPRGDGRLSLSTDSDKCAMVNFGGDEQKSLILNFNIQKCEFCAQIQINNLQYSLGNLVLVFPGR